MANFTPLYTESNLIGYLVSGITASASSIQVQFYDKVTGAARTPQSSTLLFVIDKGTALQPNPNYEIVLATSHSTTGGITTLSTVTRGIAFYGNSLAAGTGKSHVANAEVGCVDVHHLWNQLTTVLDGTNSPTGLKLGIVPVFEGTGIYKDRVFADATARDAAITSPANGMSCYCTTEGQFYDYVGGSWQARAAGTNPNASATVAGKVEIATSAESIAGTDTGGTGALLSVLPSDQAINIQNNKHTYYASAVGTDSYAITPTPAISAYAGGQVFYFYADVDNTGACTLNVNAKGATPIYKWSEGSLVDLEDGDIKNGQINQVVYNPGGSFNLLSPVSSVLTKAHKNTLVGGTASDANGLHKHTFAYGQTTHSATHAATTTKNITHGLGNTPNWVKVTCNANVSLNIGSAHSVGIYNGTTYATTYSVYRYSGTIESGVSNSEIIFIRNEDGSASKEVRGTVTITATELQFSFVNDAVSEDTTLNILWECGV